MRLVGLALLLALAPVEAGRVVVYGGTPAGVTAAVAAARLGETVTVVEPSRHVGGVVSGGLVRTDLGRRETIGGLANEFFARCLAYYVQTYGADSPQVAESRGGVYMEPRIAEQVFGALLAEAGVTVHLGQRLTAVAHDGRRLVSLTCVDAAGQRREHAADGFIDATYEGDLMAAAGVPYVVGREGRSEYGERYAGIRAGPPEVIGRGDHRVQAYNYRLCLTQREDLRLLPEQPANYDPARYGILLQSILERGTTSFGDILNLVPTTNGKVDANNGLAWQSSDWVGANHAYPEAGPAEREAIATAHLEYVQGLVWFVQNDPRVPAVLRDDARTWGLARDEFVDNGHWPHQLYVREARRMLGRRILTERDLLSDRHKPDSIGLGSYTIDCHGVRLVRSPSRGWSHEGSLGIPVKPYEIPYGALCPPELANLLVPVCCSASHVAYCSLRMEPVYMILGHAAGVALHLAAAGGTSVQDVPIDRLQTLLREQGALLEAPFVPLVDIRITPAEGARPGQPLRFEVLEREVREPLRDIWWELDGDGQVDATGPTAEFTPPADGTYTAWLLVRDAAGRSSELTRAEVVVGQGGPREILVDDDDPLQTSSFGLWQRSGEVQTLGGSFYRHDRNDPQGKGRTAFRFRPRLETPGRYTVSFAVNAHPNRASNVPLVVYHADGETTLTLDQRTAPGPFAFVTLGTFRFAAGTDGSVLVRTTGTEGFVTVDAVRFVWAGP